MFQSIQTAFLVQFNFLCFIQSAGFNARYELENGKAKLSRQIPFFDI